ncbi:hypothetical protein NBRC10512_006958 [Rhodotorula toruloides]|uniref:RHTO0S13e04874g1_1 n=2 Tax=Rhodotorula toruloides TaxID=5286 RepID=A0A061BCE5_RHOTO|nr:transcriptional activator protein DAL81 [Rhodotorula toruloides NP11]EMS22374.1 transcriptional activator protein DAL81 [Rhodotorula toruloides NP11]CDR47026.1 RHTO0S13e04874g1_1 [Rhodotorula toruloides]
MCRKRKNRCAVPVEGEPCVECKATGRSCTYLLPPPARPKKDATSQSPTSALTDLPLPPLTSTSLTQPSNSLPALAPTARPAPSALKRPRVAFSAGEPAQKRAAVLPAASWTPASLDRDLPEGVEPCAVTATLTDDLLNHQTVGTSRQISSDHSRAQFILFHATPSHRPLLDDFEATTLRRVRSFIASTAPHLSEETLIDHYLSFIHPTLPVLPLSPIHPPDSLPPSLRASILVETLGYFPSLRGNGDYAWRLLKEEKLGERMLDRPKLSSLATAILELSTSMDPRGDYALLAKTIAHAQLLGLHIDCRSWAIPDWEKSLRQRLWWCLRIHDAWASFLNSRPSHIQAGNANVPLPTFAAHTTASDVDSTEISFVFACRLALVVGQLQAEVSTLDNYGSSSRADACDALEKDLNALKESIRGYVSAHARSPGMDCLLFCLFALRCMIRRINIEVRIGLGSAFAPDGNTLEIFAEFVTFCSMLRESSFGAEQSWLPYTSHILSSVLSSLVRLSLASLSSRHSPSASVTSHASSFDRPATPTSSPVLLLGRLCSVLHAARDSYGWTRADAALSRAASVAERLTSAMHADAASDDYSEVIAALQSTNLAEDAGMDANGAGADDALVLDALASLAGAAEEGGYGEMPAAVDGLGRLASSAGGVSMGDSLGLFGSNALELPDLEEWLNVLDQPQEWGQDVGFDASVGSGW